LKEVAAGVKKVRSEVDVRRRLSGLETALGEEEPEKDDDGAREGRVSGMCLLHVVDMLYIMNTFNTDDLRRRGKWGLGGGRLQDTRHGNTLKVKAELIISHPTATR
jgi:hypothetical protein